MKTEDHLFSLVKSLNQHEKRYFRLHAGRHKKEKGSHFLRLFDFMDRQEHFDEEALQQHFAGDALGRQLAVYKNLLYHVLLRSLQSYRYESSPGMKLRSGIDKVEVLMERGKHAAALKMLTRTQAQAEEYAQHGYILELLGWERRLLRFLQPLTYLEELPRIEAYERKWVLIQKQESAATRIYDRLFAWVQVERRMEKGKFATQLAEVGAQLSALEVELLPAFTTNTTLLNAKALFRQLNGDYEGMMAAYAELIAFWDMHPRIKSADPKKYARLQIAWLNSTLAAGKIGAQLPAIRALRKIPIQGIGEHARTVFQSYNLELLWLMDRMDVDAAVRFLSAFEDRLPEMHPFLDEIRLSSFYLNATILYFRRADYISALKWATRTEANSADNPDTLFFRAASILSLICNCETGNFQAAESKLATIKRKIGKQDADWEFGRIITNSIGRILQKWGLPESKPMKDELHQSLVELEKKVVTVPIVLDLAKHWAAHA